MNIIKKLSSKLYFSKLGELWRNIKYPFRNFYIGISNIIKWTPVLYQDRNWDHIYILKILVFKLKLTRKKLAEDDIVCDEELSKMLESLDRCIFLFEKLNNEWENYEEPQVDIMESKWGKSEFNIKEGFLDIKTPGIKNEEDQILYRNDLLKSYEDGEKNWNDDFKEVMEIFRLNLRNWWD